ncbi:MAG TPA: ATP-binding protein [Thioalkalivibrio sp.]|nr:ATP-binding protein [Thioalkalivibrio sp.]
MDIDMTDVTLHIDEALDTDQLEHLESRLRAQEGVISVGRRPDRPHLMVVEYNPRRATGERILSTVRSDGLHAELIGL